MIPGEIITQSGEIELNQGRDSKIIKVANTGDRPIQVGSHFHFFEVNAALAFDREQTRGMRLDIPAGTAVRFEPGDEKEVVLVALAGSRQVYGFNNLIDDFLDQKSDNSENLDNSVQNSQPKSKDKKKEKKDKKDKHKKH